MNELKYMGAGAGKSFAARIRRDKPGATGLQVLNLVSGAFEDWVDANLANYRKPMTDAGGGAYIANLPTLAGSVVLPSGTYVIEYEDLSGAFDQAVAEPFEWDGTARVRIASRLAQTQYVGPVIEGTVASASPTTTTFLLTGTNLSASDSIYSDQKMYVIFTSGVNRSVRKLITGYVGSTKQVTCKAFPNPPAQNDTCWIVS